MSVCVCRSDGFLFLLWYPVMEFKWSGLTVKVLLPPYPSCHVLYFIFPMVIACSLDFSLEEYNIENFMSAILMTCGLLRHQVSFDAQSI